MISDIPIVAFDGNYIAYTPETGLNVFNRLLTIWSNGCSDHLDLLTWYYHDYSNLFYSKPYATKAKVIVDFSHFVHSRPVEEYSIVKSTYLTDTVQLLSLGIPMAIAKHSVFFKNEDDALRLKLMLTSS